MEGHRKRHCWECRRRYLVCDSTEPACKRCSTSGIECPGYNDVKPTRFKWLAPGRITSRRRRRNGALPPETENSYNKIATRTITEIANAAMGTHVATARLEMGTEACALAQAAEYFNSCIYRDLAPIHELGQNPHIYPLSVTLLRVAATSPDYLRFGMVCMTLAHRINRTRGNTQSKALAEKFYLYWGLALRSLSEHLAVEGGRISDMAIAGILTLLFADVSQYSVRSWEECAMLIHVPLQVQQGTSLSWRCHLEGVHKIIMLRGGPHVVAGSRSLEPLLLSLWFVTVIGNTTCPASDVTMINSQLDVLDLLLGRYGTTVSPFQLCPLPLFAEIIKINHLRLRATTYDANRAEEDLFQEANEALKRIHSFSPEQWAGSKLSCKEDWMLMGKVYQAAVALYCILSLQSLSVLPATTALRACCIAHGQLLQLLLNEGLPSPRIKRFLLWPLVLLGVEAVQGGAAMRAFVSRQLPELSRVVGIYVPLTAKRVLETFWDSGETRWDACFDRPYAFTTQIAVDTRRFYPDSLVNQGSKRLLPE
ncbi:hypothetical protein AAE478_001900 [Parahypoxylon ruwenzoriense]